MIESDPTAIYRTQQVTPTPGTYTSAPKPVFECRADSSSYSVTIPGPPPVIYNGVTTVTCRRRQVIEEGFSPVGLRVNFLTKQRIQPTLSSYAGYMFAMQQVPVPDAGLFYFTFEFGGGVEVYQSHGRSLRVEYVVQHVSNKDIGDVNPGLDSGFAKMTYSFGR